MKEFVKVGFTYTVSIIAFVFLFLPERLFEETKILFSVSAELNIIINRIVLSILICVVTFILLTVWYAIRKKVRIMGRGYTIEIVYGDLFKQKKSKKVIPFDECFTTSVGTSPADINPTSVCGQYLERELDLDINALIMKAGLKPDGKSKYAGKDRYQSGSLLNNSEFLLMSFAKLDKEGVGRMTYAEYLCSLSVLWNEIDKYYGQEDVCIPIIGAGITRLKDKSLTKQELLDTIIASYKLAQAKIHKPNKLVIVCRRKDVSLNKIGSCI